MYRHHTPHERVVLVPRTGNVQLGSQCSTHGLACRLEQRRWDNVVKDEVTVRAQRIHGDILRTTARHDVARPNPGIATRLTRTTAARSVIARLTGCRAERADLRVAARVRAPLRWCRADPMITSVGRRRRTPASEDAFAAPLRIFANGKGAASTRRFGVDHRTRRAVRSIEVTRAARIELTPDFPIAAEERVAERVV